MKREKMKREKINLKNRISKNGIMRIIEAFVAIMLIAAFLLIIFYGKISTRNDDKSIMELERIILEKLSTDDKMRQVILNSYGNTPQALGNKSIIESEIRALIPYEFNFTFNVCNLNQICSLPNKRSFYTDKEIYSDEISISATLTQYDPKKLRLFIWESEY